MGVLNFIKISFILFSTTQIILPLSKILPDLLFQFYPIFLDIKKATECLDKMKELVEQKKSS